MFGYSKLQGQIKAVAKLFNRQKKEILVVSKLGAVELHMTGEYKIINVIFKGEDKLEFDVATDFHKCYGKARDRVTKKTIELRNNLSSQLL